MNIKAIAKAIKSESSKGCVIWQLKDGVHYVTNRHWAVKLPTMPTDVLTALLTVFNGQQPDDGMTLVKQSGRIADPAPSPDVTKAVCNHDLTQTGAVTPFTYDSDKLSMRLVTVGDLLYTIDAKYADFIDFAKVSGCVTQTITSKTPTTPLYFCDGLLVILPIRTTEDIKGAIAALQPQQTPAAVYSA